MEDTKLKRYKLINTTVKPPKLHPRTGQDLRSTVDKVGHSLEVILDNGASVIIDKYRPRIVDHVNEGMHRLQRTGLLKIEVIEDVTAMLKPHVLDGTKDSILKPDENVKYEAPVHPAAEARAVKIVLMGEKAVEPTGDMEGAINPDGEPSFVVKATKDMKLTRKPRVREDQPASEAPLEPNA
jgi:hypothetical protein